MKALKALAVLGLLATGLAIAQSNGPLNAARTFTFACPSDGGTCTGSAPTAGDHEDGVSLSKAAAYNVSVDASPDGGSVTVVSGGLKCYFDQVDYSSGVHGSAMVRGWAPGATSLDVASIPAGRRYPAPTYSVGVGAGRVKCVPNAVVLSTLSVLPDGGANVGQLDMNVSIEVQRVQTETR